MMKKSKNNKSIFFRLLGVLMIMFSSTLLLADLPFETSQSFIIPKPQIQQDSIYSSKNIDVAPSYPGGIDALILFLGKNTKYPNSAKENGIQGKVYVGFIIDKQGKVTDVKIKKGVSEVLDQEAIRVVSSMPDWTAGELKGKKVKVYYVLPINFKL